MLTYVIKYGNFFSFYWKYAFILQNEGIMYLSTDDSYFAIYEDNWLFSTVSC